MPAMEVLRREHLLQIPEWLSLQLGLLLEALGWHRQRQSQTFLNIQREKQRQRNKEKFDEALKSLLKCPETTRQRNAESRPAAFF